MLFRSTTSKHLGHLDWSEIHRARGELVDADLLAFRPFSEHDPNGFTQVLALTGRRAPSEVGR